MNNRTNLRLLLSVFLVGSVLISACAATSSVRIGWACFNGAQKLDCSYREFSGREVGTQRLEAGQAVTVQYDIDVDSGVLSFMIEDPSGQEIFTVSLTEPLEDTFTFTADEDGRYRFILEGEGTEGAFRVEWGQAG